MKENIFEKKYAEALVAEDPEQGNRAVGMAIVSPAAVLSVRDEHTRPWSWTDELSLRLPSQSTFSRSRLGPAR